MATKKKLLQAAAGSAGGAGGLNVEEVFSTYLYDGTSANRDIVNDIDLSTEGGAVWFKGRSSAYNHILYDTERGVKEVLRPNRTDANSQLFGTNGLTAFNTNGFSITGGNGELNYSGQDYASWTFRKAPKFFDVVTYTGNSTAGRTVSHNLGTDVGFMIIKNTTSSGDWICWHRGASTDAGRILKLNATDAVAFNSAMLNNTNPTSTEFTVGTNYDTNGSGQTYVAYLFAHNNGDGEFGPDGDADIIKCGSFVPSSTWQSVIDIGFEPQWIMYKKATGTGGWHIHDNMRGIVSGAADNLLYANATDAEVNYVDSFTLHPNGFEQTFSSVDTNTYIYIAIRRGPMGIPESATDVFAIDTRDGSTLPTFTSGFPVDFHIYKTTATSSWRVFDRLRGANELQTASTAAEASNIGDRYTQDQMEGIGENTGTSSSEYQWMWRRAPNYFDVVCYDGAGSGGTTIDHNLGVAPEMIWTKTRNDTQGWFVYHKGANGGTNPENYYLRLDTTAAESDFSTPWNDTAPTATQFFTGNLNGTGASGDTHIAYLFATLAGVSKVGSYTGNGSSQNIDCGFSSGARFVLIKCSNDTGDWNVFDTARGIVAGNDSRLILNGTDAELTGYDAIDPLSSGFTINSAIGDLNDNGQSYIFYAIA